VTRALNVLLVEDEVSDAELVLHVLRRATFRCTHRRVDTEAHFRRELESQLPDLILSDYSMPQFDGMRALTIAHEICPDVPFIFVSGTIGEETAIKALKSGAVDYVLKHDLARLPPAIDRALQGVQSMIEQRRVLAALQHSEQRFRLAASTGDVWDWDVASGMAHISAQWKQRLGYQDQDVANTAEAWLALLEPGDRRVVLAAFAAHLKGRLPYDVEYRVRTKSGDFHWFHAKGQAVWNEHGRATYMAGSMLDITERKRAELKVRRLNRVYAVLSGINALIVRVQNRNELFRGACQIAVDVGQFDLAWIGMAKWDMRRVVPVAWSGAGGDYIRNMPLSLDASDLQRFGLIGRAATGREVIVVQDVATDLDAAHRQEVLALGVRCFAILPLSIAGGVVGVIALYAGEPGFFDEAGMALLRDLAGDIAFALDHLGKSEKLNYLAYYDALTGLPNRSLMLDRLSQLLQTTNNETGERSPVALVLMNIDRFKNINDILGRHAGDALLKLVAQRLVAISGSTDRLARIGADQFAVVMAYRSEPAEVAHVLEDQVLAALSRPFVLDGRELYLTFRIGVAMFPGDGETADALLANAESASRTAAAAEGRYQFYAPSMNARVMDKLSIENKLHRALERNEFLLHYQPKVSLLDGRITGAEALLRWNDPDRGLVSPASFIPILEETGMIVDVGRWVLERALADFRMLRDSGLDPPRVAVNISAVQVKRRDFLKLLEKALAGCGPEQNLLDFELTESLLMEDIETNVRLFRAMREMGIRLAIDDFGTGYSSLSYLKRFPIDYLKIDQSFVREITTAPDAAAICVAVIDLAHNLKLKVIAEGVETDEQMSYLRRRHCDEMQGYLFSRPVPMDQLEALLRRHMTLDLPELTREERKTILIVDDDAGALSAIKRLLRHEGYEIFTANGAREGFEILARNDVQVILSDQRMPEMSGSEFLSRVRDLYPDTIRIVLSGYTDLEFISNAINRGAIYKFLSKPWDDELLRRNIQEAFRHHEVAKRKC